MYACISHSIVFVWEFSTQRLHPILLYFLCYIPIPNSINPSVMLACTYVLIATILRLVQVVLTLAFSFRCSVKSYTRIVRILRLIVIPKNHSFRLSTLLMLIYVRFHKNKSNLNSFRFWGLCPGNFHFTGNGILFSVCKLRPTSLLWI